MRNTKKNLSLKALNRLLESLAAQIIAEQEDSPEPASKPSAPVPKSSPDSSGSDGGGPSAPEADLGAQSAESSSSGASEPGGGMDSISGAGAPGDASAADSGGAGDGLSDGDMPGGDSEMDMADNTGGGGFGGGFAGGGFGGGGGGGFSSGSSDDGDSSGDDGPKADSITPSGEPEKDQEDPVGAAVREAEKLAGQTTEVQKILNGIKASIQVNFSDYRQAWPIVSALRDTNNKTLEAVASRLALFIADVLQETKNRENKTMKITKEQLRKLVREAVRQKLLSENSSYLEQEKMRQEVNMLALEFLEKLTQKLSIDPATLSPEALESYKAAHKNLEVAVRTAAAELFRLGAVVSAASDGSPEGK